LSLFGRSVIAETGRKITSAESIGIAEYISFADAAFLFALMAGSRSQPLESRRSCESSSILFSISVTSVMTTPPLLSFVCLLRKDSLLYSLSKLRLTFKQLAHDELGSMSFVLEMSPSSTSVAKQTKRTSHTEQANVSVMH
jgi:hypothetical protein